METKVVHCKKEKYTVYIGRPSKWGNPYSHKAGTLAKFRTATREEAIQKFKEWITIGDGKHLLNDLHELEGEILGCWCDPESCHGNVLVDLINKPWSMFQITQDGLIDEPRFPTGQTLIDESPGRPITDPKLF